MTDAAYALGPDEEGAEPEDTGEDQQPDMELLRAALAGENLVDMLDEADVAKLAEDVFTGFEQDEQSMEDWESRGKKGLELAQMVATEKTYPWPKAANAKFPLIAQAALQFNARVYPALVPPDGPVHVKVWGQDKDGAKQKRADRVREFMGFQLAVSAWEADIDSMTIRLPIIGAVFRKVVYDKVRGMVARNCGRVVLNNDCPEWSQMPRISEEFELYPNEIVERIRGERFVDFDWQGYTDEDEYGPQEFIEQHCRHDLDGDGYPEPYVVTLHKPSRKVVRVAANFDKDDVSMSEAGQIARIAAREYFVPFTFLPAMDGTFLGIGLGHLLGNTSEVINGLINQILDAGHMASLGGGFLGTGLNLKGGPIRLRPGEFKPVPASGANVRDAVVPMTFPGPSDVLFQMLGLLIESGKDVSAISDTMTGDVPRQQPATTTLALIEQGMAVFTAAFKRMYRGLKTEFKLMARINAETVRPEVYQQLQDGEEPADPKRDFDLADMDIQPVADPAKVTNMQRMAKAQLLMEMLPMGVVDPREAHIRVLEAAGIEDRERLVPEPDPQAVAMANAQAAMIQALQTALLEADLAQKHADVEKTVSETEENRAEALKDISDSLANQEGMRIERMLRLLEIINQARANETRGAERVAGKPADRGSAAQPKSGGGAAQIPDLRDVLAVG